VTVARLGSVGRGTWLADVQLQDLLSRSGEMLMASQYKLQFNGTIYLEIQGNPPFDLSIT
jgi:hypothetical protein